MAHRWALTSSIRPFASNSTKPSCITPTSAAVRSRSGACGSLDCGGVGGLSLTESKRVAVAAATHPQGRRGLQEVVVGDAPAGGRARGAPRPAGGGAGGAPAARGGGGGPPPPRAPPPAPPPPRRPGRRGAPPP